MKFRKVLTKGIDMVVGHDTCYGSAENYCYGTDTAACHAGAYDSCSYDSAQCGFSASDVCDADYAGCAYDASDYCGYDYTSCQGQGSVDVCHGEYIDNCDCNNYDIDLCVDT